RFFITQCPTTLGYVAAMRGLRAPRPTEPFTYCDLGCGKGLTVNVLAAAMPQARFYGVDLSADHIEAARRTATAGGLLNATFIKDDFANLAEREDLPAFDFIALQGVYSWVDADARQKIQQTVRRLLKPEGLLYVSYNALTGWAPFLPIRQTLRLLVGQASGTPAERAAAAFRYIREVAERAPYFQNSPAARKLLDEVAKEKRGYVIHEFLAGAWDLFTFDEVAEEMASIGLSYCGSALLEPNAGDTGLAPELQPAARAIADPIAAEAVRSFLKAERYRADIFSMSRPAEGWLGRWDDFADQVFGPPMGVMQEPQVRGGALAESVRAFFAVTQTGRASLAQIAKMEPFSGADTETMLRIAHAATRTFARRPYARPALEEVVGPDRIRLALPIHEILLAMAEEESRVALPSPVLGTGIILPFAAAFILDAACRVGVQGALEPAVRRLLDSERVWTHDGKRLETEKEIRPAMAQVHGEFRDRWLPFLLRAGVVEAA
ncbi:MAG: methyltransferase domain-containing protein, partial [Rhodospirillaceae bacterium]|nr:methyltransferase domain-containing protein [Rhodospirillaceae bacterium]